MAPALPDGVVVLDHTAYFEAMWHQAEECTGKTYPFSRITLYMVPTKIQGFAYRDDFGKKVDSLAGYARRDRNLVLLGSPWVSDDQIVRHEFVHILASPEGHNPLYYGLWEGDVLVVPGKCSKYVICGQYCRQR